MLCVFRKKPQTGKGSHYAIERWRMRHRLLGVSPRTVSVEFRWKVGFEGVTYVML